MATWAYPPLPPGELKKQEDESLAKELKWLLNSLQESLTSLKSGLEECVALLAPKEPGSTLVLSSLRSESVKGFVTRIGTKIVKGDIHLRLPTLPPPPNSKTPTYHLTLSTSPYAPPLLLPQLTTVLHLVNNSLDAIDVSTYTGNPHDAHFISGQLRLLQDYLSEARLVLKGSSSPLSTTPDASTGDGATTAATAQGEGERHHHHQDHETTTPSTTATTTETWYNGGSAPPEAFDPPLPPTVSFHLSIHDASLVLHLRTLEPVTPHPHSHPHSHSFTSSSSSSSSTHAPDAISTLAGGISSLFGRGPKLPIHDEVDRTFMFRGQEVRVREKVRVESASDPSLIAVMAKVGALEHGVKQLGRALGTVMGVEHDAEGEEGEE